MDYDGYDENDSMETGSGGTQPHAKVKGEYANEFAWCQFIDPIVNQFRAAVGTCATRKDASTRSLCIDNVFAEAQRQLAAIGKTRCFTGARLRYVGIKEWTHKPNPDDSFDRWLPRHDVLAQLDGPLHTYFSNMAILGKEAAQDEALQPFLPCLQPNTWKERRACIATRCAAEKKMANNAYVKAVERFNQEMARPLGIQDSKEVCDKVESARKECPEKEPGKLERETLWKSRCAPLFWPSPLLETVYHAGCKRGCCPANTIARCADHQESLLSTPDLFVCARDNTHQEQLDAAHFYLRQTQKLMGW